MCRAARSVRRDFKSWAESGLLFIRGKFSDTFRPQRPTFKTFAENEVRNCICIVGEPGLAAIKRGHETVARGRSATLINELDFNGSPVIASKALFKRF